MDGSQLLLTPEKSIHYQNQIGADIMMALDDVCSSLTVGPRVEEAMHRTLRWIDRCIGAHKRPKDQNLFGIVQGAFRVLLLDFVFNAILFVFVLMRREMPRRRSGRQAPRLLPARDGQAAAARLRDRRSGRRRGQGAVLARRAPEHGTHLQDHGACRAAH